MELNLGRPTRRGIKKCPKCATFNGSRGLVCKNKLCDAVFKDYANKQKPTLDPVRLSGIVRQIYSVRVCDRGPDRRGFVQLPLSEDRSLLSENALCFVDSCQRLFKDSFLKYHQLGGCDAGGLLCAHIDSAIKSASVGVAIGVKKDLVNGLKVDREVKGDVWRLALETEGPLVQRVSRTVLVVKCQVSPKHPLGYLHFSFGCSKGSDIYDKYYCSCTDFRVSGSGGFKCVHYYACVCALASGPKYLEEFAQFISYEFSKKTASNDITHTNKSINVNLLRSTKIRKSKRHNGTKKLPKLLPNIFPVEIKVLEPDENITKAAEAPSWKFVDWLTYVTESINQTMQFENYGIINTLIFCIPQPFFDEFKKRIPDMYRGSLQVFPIETFRVMNILHVKEIFDSRDVKLKISKRFYHDAQKGYVEYVESHDGDLCQSDFIFFLNVGQSTVDESDNTNNPFLIEWMAPHCANVAKIGQLKLHYKYGRKNTTEF